MLDGSPAQAKTKDLKMLRALALGERDITYRVFPADLLGEALKRGDVQAIWATASELVRAQAIWAMTSFAARTENEGRRMAAPAGRVSQRV